VQARGDSIAVETETHVEFDYCVVGGGIAGLSLAWELAAAGRVVVCEREAQVSYHSTGRSAALFAESYGNAVVRSLTRASREFYLSPPAGFGSALISARGALYVATSAQHAELMSFHNELSAGGAALALVDGAEARRRVPILSASVDAAYVDPSVCDIDVAAVVDGFRRGFRARGGVLLTTADVHRIERIAKRWHVAAGTQQLNARLLIDAAGAWADEMAEMAGASRMGLQPRRRTAALVDLPPGMNARGWPTVADVSDRYYFKPDGDRLLISPADEAPCEPCDAQPEDFDVAEAVDRIEHATTLSISRVRSSWAGLRTFAPDRTPIIGFDARMDGFFWFAGQGGYGLQMAPGAARAAAALISGRSMPNELVAQGVSEELLAPSRRMSA
jgi:D-arginine dehydrogenase